MTGGGARALSAEIRSERGSHAVLGHLDSRVDPAPGMESLTLLGIDPDGMVHLLHSFLSVLVGPYTTDRRLLAFSADLPQEGLPPATELPVEFFAVRRTISTVLRKDHRVHI